MEFLDSELHLAQRLIPIRPAHLVEPDLDELACGLRDPLVDTVGGGEGRGEVFAEAAAEGGVDLDEGLGGKVGEVEGDDEGFDHGVVVGLEIVEVAG